MYIDPDIEYVLLYMYVGKCFIMYIHIYFAYIFMGGSPRKPGAVAKINIHMMHSFPVARTLFTVLMFCITAKRTDPNPFYSIFVYKMF